MFAIGEEGREVKNRVRIAVSSLEYRVLSTRKYRVPMARVKKIMIEAVSGKRAAIGEAS